MKENINFVEISKEKRAIIMPKEGIFTFDTGISLHQYQTNSVFYARKNFELMPQSVGKYKIIPFGQNNDLPEVIREIMENNNLAPGILNREIGLLMGDGPQLYELKFIDGKLEREYLYDAEVWNWLSEWNFRRFVEMACVEYKYMNGIFVRQTRNKGARIGKGKIQELEVVPNKNARLEWTDSQRLEDVEGIITGNFDNITAQNIVRYNIFDTKNPMYGKITMSYHNTYTFAYNFYSLPSYYGALRWIMLNSDVPQILKYMNENSITAAYHIHIPEGYWKDKKQKLERQFPEKRDDEIETILDKIQEDLCAKIKEVLSGKKNAGKFITTVDFIDPFGDGKTVQSWKIEPIDQKIKDFVEMQKTIAEQSNSATTSGMNLHPSLSSIVVNGKLASGSEMLYAFKLYLATDTTIPEEVIFENLNQCIKANFPNKKLKMGFYHSIVKSEDSLTSSARMKNNI
ncbi:MAG: hypothetical protein LBS50_00370 [Prevotellaceae bacterium]|jgi:hypothetical protein|nr:hypothetical protein [Prevotellaceae bacterium]